MKQLSFLLIAILSPFVLLAQWQQPKIGYMRPYDKSGINVFETSKLDTVPFDGVKVRFGAGFTQEFQGLKHENNYEKVPANKLYGITPGFNTAMANLLMDVQLADGIRLNLTLYLSSRHHNEAWVKGGYIQFDKLPFKGQFWDDLMKYTTIKVGHMEINYGDAHFRRTDAGQSIYNPFIESYILNAFTTEIGGEVYLQKDGFFGMLGVANGMIKGNIDSLSKTAQDDNIHKSPSIYLKGGIDRNVADNIRVRLAASYYHNGSSASNTLYSGDRAGSHYFMVLEPEDGDYAENASSGRLNPSFSKKVDAVMLNAFLKAYGLEIFGTYENARGRTKTEVTERTMNQYAVDGIYRFGKNENLFVGARYNTVKGRLSGISNDITIDRVALAGGWFLTPNILLKGEVVRQRYFDFPTTDIRNSGKFSGYVVSATVGF